MNIEEYVASIEYAATQVIPIIWTEHNQLVELETRITKLRQEMQADYEKVEWLAANPDFDDDNLATAIYWDTYFGSDKDQFYATKDKQTLEELIASRAFSTATLSANLLQYGKQGISVAYGNLAACPAGRTVGSQPLKQVLWQGRNHALHWEDGNPHPPVSACFDTLAADFGPRFAPYRSTNLAFELIDVLGWRTFDAFRDDLLTLR